MAWADVTSTYQKGICQVCGEPTRMYFCANHREPKARPVKVDWFRPPANAERESVKSVPSSAPADDGPTAEAVPAGSPSPSRPAAPRRGVLGRMFGKKSTNRPTQQAKPRQPRRKPKLLDPGGPRRAGFVVLGDGWESLGEFLTGSPFMAAGRVMTFQGEAAGMILDDAVKGTVIDKMGLQPYIAAEERYGAAFRLLSLPIQMQMVVSKWQRIQTMQASGAPSEAINAQAFQFQWQVRSAKKAIRKSLPELAKASKRQREEREKSEKAVKEAWPDLENARDEAGNPISPEDQLFNEILGPIFASPPQPPPEGTNGNQPGNAAQQPDREGDLAPRV